MVVAVGLTVTCWPLTTAPTPGAMLPVPPSNVPCSTAGPPEVTCAGVAVKESRVACPTTWMAAAVAMPVFSLLVARTW